MNNISLIASFGLLLAAYTVGGAFDCPALAWYRLFEKGGTHTRAFASFNKRHEDRWQIDIDGEDYSLWLAMIRTRNLDLAPEIDCHNAVSIMLRNVSLGLMFLGVNSLLQFLMLADISLLIIQEAKKFREMYYDPIYKTVLAYRIDLENAIKPVKKPVSKR